MLTLHTFSGRPFEVDVWPETTVGNLKIGIQNAQGIRFYNQAIVTNTGGSVTCLSNDVIVVTLDLTEEFQLVVNEEYILVNITNSDFRTFVFARPDDDVLTLKARLSWWEEEGAVDFVDSAGAPLSENWKLAEIQIHDGCTLEVVIDPTAVPSGVDFYNDPTWMTFMEWFHCEQICPCCNHMMGDCGYCCFKLQTRVL